MEAHYVFGYGSLVHRGTHAFAECHPAEVLGWRRAWRHVEGRSVAFLTAIPAPDETLLGLLARVETPDWPALDLRERSYVRDRTTDVTHPLGEAAHVHIYHAPPSLHRPSEAAHPVLLSYLDSVVAGYHAEFGTDGVRHFFETTDGWDAPILNDRAAPRYPRHQRLATGDRQMVDAWLESVGATVISDASG